MANGENFFSVTGNTGAEPELRFTASGLPVCNGRIAVNRRRKVGDQWENEANWFDFVMFGPVAENFASCVGKGQRVTLTGELSVDEWEDKETAAKRSKAVLVVDEASVNVRFGTATYERSEGGSPAQRPAHRPGEEPFEAPAGAPKPW